MKPFKPFQFQAILNWLYESDCTPFIMVNSEGAHEAVLPQDEAHEGKIMFNLMQEMVDLFRVEENWVQFSIVFGTQEKKVKFHIDELISIVEAPASIAALNDGICFCHRVMSEIYASVRSFPYLGSE